MFYYCKYQSILDDNFNEIKFISKNDNEAIKRTLTGEFYFIRKVKEVSKSINETVKTVIFINPEFKETILMDIRVKTKQDKILKFLTDNAGREFSAFKISIALRMDLTTVHRILKTIENINIRSERNEHPKRKPTKFYYKTLS